MLYPQDSETRQVISLDGIWNFKADKNDEGMDSKWYEKPLRDAILMPVPSSYNDITQDMEIRDLVGDVWYERSCFIPEAAKDRRLVLRVGSASHYARVWINGRKVTEHKGGFLPFEAVINEYVNYAEENWVTISVNNVLDWSSLPPGYVDTFTINSDPPKELKVQQYYHDFYNYGGIHRPVKIYTTPFSYISDIDVNTDIDGVNGFIRYKVSAEGECAKIRVKLLDESGAAVAGADSAEGLLTITGAHFWEPGNAYLYTLVAELYTPAGPVAVDRYRLPVGIRTVKATGKSLLINGRETYLKGLCKHEDFFIRGKGLDNAVNIKDFNLLKWIGANSFRTSHYPYSEEMMNLADRYGIMVIDETPAVGLNAWDLNHPVFIPEKINKDTQSHHMDVIRDLYQRDKNHPCVIMWSAANEAATNEPGAAAYFEPLIREFRQLDPSRPVTMVFYDCANAVESNVTDMVDIICVNEYNGWYLNYGLFELARQELSQGLQRVYDKYKKPVIMSEFGADTINGLHQNPPVMFTEEFQTEFIKTYVELLDTFDFIIGEHIWCFADFQTKQEVRRVVGNRKGIFTRERTPKAAAFFLKERWNNKKEAVKNI